MNILQLCKKFPYPFKDGESLAVYYLSKSLNELGCDITLLAMNTSKHYFEYNGNLEALAHYKEIHSVPVNNKVNIFGAVKNLFSSLPYHVSRYNSRAFKSQLIELLKNNDYDIIHLETLYVTKYISVIRKYTDAPIVLRAHNVEHEIWERVTNNTKITWKRLYLKYLTAKLKRYELAQFSSIDHLLAITHRDLKNFRSLGYHKSAIAVPIGLDTRDYMASDKKMDQPLSISFIGSLDWVPNTEGIDWFLEEIWPSILEQFKDITLHIAGRNTPASYLKKNIPNVTFYGEVEDAKAFINAHPVMIVPLLSGSGMRVKILEGLFLGRLVITTSLGLEGIEASHKDQVLIAETKEEFVKCIKFLIDHPIQSDNITKRAMVYASRYYDNLQIGKDVKDFYQTKVRALEAVSDQFKPESV